MIEKAWMTGFIIVSVILIPIVIASVLVRKMASTKGLNISKLN